MRSDRSWSSNRRVDQYQKFTGTINLRYKRWLDSLKMLGFFDFFPPPPLLPPNRMIIHSWCYSIRELFFADRIVLKQRVVSNYLSSRGAFYIDLDKLGVFHDWILSNRESVVFAEPNRTCIMTLSCSRTPRFRACTLITMKNLRNIPAQSI